MALQDLFAPPTGTPSEPQVSLHEFIYGEEKKAGGGILKALELIGRPQLALGEALGAFAHEEDPWEAAKRGLAGERKYGTPGELLFPEKPEADTLEAIFRKGAGVGVDILTDPAWLIGAPLVGKGVGAAAKVVTKVAGKHKELLAPFARYLLPITTQLRSFGGKGGKQIANLLDKAENTKAQRLATANVELGQKVKELGLGKSEALRNAAREHIESGALRAGVAHSDARVQELARWISGKKQEIGRELEGFVDPAGGKFQILEPVLRSVQTSVLTQSRKLGVTSTKWRNAIWAHLTTGVALPAGAPRGAAKLAEFARKKLTDVGAPMEPGAISVFNKEFYRRPFKPLEDYFAHLPTPDFLKSLGTDEGLSSAATALAKANGISVFEARKILRQFGSPRRAGNIEFARTVNLPDYEKDPLKALPRYFEQVFGRLEYAKRFGVSGSVLDKLLKVTKRVPAKGGGFRKVSGLTAGDAELIRGMILGHPTNRTGWERAAKAVMAYQVMTKMGPLSAISNISQNANTVVREGGTNFLKGIFRGMTKEGGRQGTIAYSGGVRQALMEIMGGSGKWAQRWLTWSGFSPAERINRLLGANAGIIAAERLVRQSKGVLTNDALGRDLLRRGLTADDLPRIAANGWKLPQDIGDRVGMLASNATQHATKWKDIPLAWQSPGMKVALQYKSFVYQQTRFLFREVVNPALKYFQTNGKDGAVAPLLRFTAAFGLGGQVVAHLRDSAKGLFAKVLRMEHDPREPVPDDWALRAIEDSLQMGALGAAGDLASRAAQRDIAGWILGPTVGDATDIMELLTGQGLKIYKDREIDPLAFGRQALRHVPGFAPLVPGRLRGEFTEERLGDLEMLLYGQ